jgi:hypothetical protein
MDFSFDWSDPIAVERELAKVGKELVASFIYTYYAGIKSGIFYKKNDTSPEAGAFLAHEVGHWQLGHDRQGFDYELDAWDAVLQQRRYYVTRNTVQLKLVGYIVGLPDNLKAAATSEMNEMLDRYF